VCDNGVEGFVCNGALSIFTYFFQRSVTGNNFGVPAQLSSSSSPSSRSAFDEPPPPPPGLLHVDRIADCEWVSRGSSALCALTAALLEEELFNAAAAAITAGGGGKLDSLFNCLNDGVPSLSPAAAAEDDDDEEEEAKARASSSGVSAAVEMGAAAGAS
jgi:hypothetical protein